MAPWLTLLREQRSTNFADLTGMLASFTIPVSDRLLSRMIAERLPRSSPVSELQLHAEDGNRITVAVKLGRLAFLPAMRIRLIIVRQPDLPASPVLVFRMVLEGAAALASPALRFLEGLPAGVRVEKDELSIDLATLLAQYGAAEALAFVTALELTTSSGRVIVSGRLALPPRGPAVSS
ncbi:MAG: hypothetical protein ABI868_12625 [Acidobacteriota bacterium]